MQRSIKIFFVLSFLIFFGVALSSVDTFGEGHGYGPAAKNELHQRIDFSSSQILGQSIKSGAVYLMHRKKSDIHTMIEVRQNYRTEIKDDFEIEKTDIAGKDTDK